MEDGNLENWKAHPKHSLTESLFLASSILVTSHDERQHPGIQFLSMFSMHASHHGLHQIWTLEKMFV